MEVLPLEIKRLVWRHVASKSTSPDYAVRYLLVNSEWFEQITPLLYTRADNTDQLLRKWFHGAISSDRMREVYLPLVQRLSVPEISSFIFYMALGYFRVFPNLEVASLPSNTTFNRHLIAQFLAACPSLKELQLYYVGQNLNGGEVFDWHEHLRQVTTVLATRPHLKLDLQVDRAFAAAVGSGCMPAPLYRLVFGTPRQTLTVSELDVILHWEPGYHQLELSAPLWLVTGLEVDSKTVRSLKRLKVAGFEDGASAARLASILAFLPNLDTLEIDTDIHALQFFQTLANDNIVLPNLKHMALQADIGKQVYKQTGLMIKRFGERHCLETFQFTLNNLSLSYWTNYDDPGKFAPFFENQTSLKALTVRFVSSYTDLKEISLSAQVDCHSLLYTIGTHCKLLKNLDIFIETTGGLHGDDANLTSDELFSTTNPLFPKLEYFEGTLSGFDSNEVQCLHDQVAVQFPRCRFGVINCTHCTRRRLVESVKALGAAKAHASSAVKFRG